MNIKASCVQCGKPVKVDIGKKYVSISAHKKCNAPVKVTWEDSDGALQQTKLEVE